MDRDRALLYTLLSLIFFMLLFGYLTSKMKTVEGYYHPPLIQTGEQTRFNV